MTPPNRLSETDVQLASLLSLIPVPRAGQKARIVGHLTESGVTLAKSADSKLVHHDVDVMASIENLIMASGFATSMWKRDVSKAFRRLPLHPDDAAFACVVFAVRGLHWVALHLANIFCTKSAVTRLQPVKVKSTLHCLAGTLLHDASELAL